MNDEDEDWWAMPNKLAVVTTHDRPEVLKRCLDAIAPQVDRVIVIDNNTVQDQIDDVPFHALVIPTPGQPPNLSKFWNIGLDLAHRFASPQNGAWHVAVLNDDAIVPPGWFEAVVAAMARTRAVAGCSGAHSALHTRAEPVDLMTRMTGWAFILHGNEGLRADERFEWYFGDDDLDWQARQRGGMVMISTHQTQNLYPNGSFTPELHARTAIDAQNFVGKWGRRPW